MSAFVTSTACYVQFPADKPDDETYLDIRGALCFNYNLSTWKEDQLKRGGNFGFEIFCINVEAEYKGIKLNAEYRLNAAGCDGGI